MPQKVVRLRTLAVAPAVATALRGGHGNGICCLTLCIVSQQCRHERLLSLTVPSQRLLQAALSASPQLLSHWSNISSISSGRESGSRVLTSSGCDLKQWTSLTAAAAVEMWIAATIQARLLNFMMKEIIVAGWACRGSKCCFHHGRVRGL